MTDNSQPILSVSGLRGIVGRSLTPQVAMRYAAALAAELPPGPIVIARDGRPTGTMFCDAVRAALNAAGREVLNAGVAATPTLGVLIRDHRAAGGVQISASHNPPQYNGLKLMDASGRVLSGTVGQRVVQRHLSGTITQVTHEAVGTSRNLDDTTDGHLRRVLATINETQIARRRYRVLLDSNHGAGSILGRLLLEELGCQLTILGETPHGRFAHPPEPTEENLRDVCRHVQDHGPFDITFCQDPDADRLAVIDERGRYMGEEYTLALCLDHVLEVRPRDASPAAGEPAVVTNCATSLMSEAIAQKHGALLHRTPVGEAHVVDRMLREEAVFGGEGNGGPIDPRIGWIRDSFVGMALILDAMSRRQLPVSQLADTLPRYVIRKTQVALPRNQVPAALERLRDHFEFAEMDDRDGLRLDWPDRWVLVRPSNTEPIVRLIAEARSQTHVDQLCDEVQRVLERDSRR